MKGYQELESKSAMGENPFDFFDMIYCINLPEREDRRKECIEEFKKVGIEEKVVFVDGVKATVNSCFRGRIGCAMSHRNCLQLAHEAGYGKILVLEDDIKFFDNTNSELFKSIKELSPRFWYLFYLGSNLSTELNSDLPYPPIEKYADDLLLTRCSLTTHAIAYNYSMIGELLELFPEKEEEWVGWMSENESIDGFLARKIQRRGFSFHTEEYIASQRESISDIDGNLATFGETLKTHFDNTKKEYFG